METLTKFKKDVDNGFKNLNTLRSYPNVYGSLFMRHYFDKALEMSLLYAKSKLNYQINENSRTNT